MMGRDAMENEQQGRQLLFVVMAAVSLWGGLLSLGALLFGYDAATGTVGFAPRLLRGAIVLGCVLTFLSGWALLVWCRFGRRKDEG